MAVPKSLLKAKTELGETYFPKVLLFGGTIVLLIIAPVPLVFAKESFGRSWLLILIGVLIAIVSLMTWAGSLYPNRLRKRMAKERREAIRHQH